MIYVIARLSLKPETRDAVAIDAKICAQATRKESGCLRYDVNLDLFDPNIMTFVEEWESRDHLDMHFTQPHMEIWRTAVSANLESVTIEVITPEGVEKL